MLPPEAAPARLCHLVPCAAGRGQAALLRRCIWRRGGIRGSGETQQPRHCRRSNDSSPLTGLLPASAPAASAQRGHWVYAGCCSRAQLSFSISVTINLFHLAAERSAEELLEQLPHRGQPRADGTLLLCCTMAIWGCWASPAMGEADLAAAFSQNTAAAPSPCESMLLARTRYRTTLYLSHGDSLYLTLINHRHAFLPFGGTPRFVARSHGLCRSWHAPDHVQRGCSSPETPVSSEESCTTAGPPLTTRSCSPSCRALALTASGHACQCPMEILPPRLGYAQVRNLAGLLPRTDHSNKYRKK